MGQDRRIGLALDAVAAGLELAPELAVIVDLAVEDHLHPARLIGHRLVPSEDAGDGKTRVAEEDARPLEDSLVVGPAMLDESDGRVGRPPIGKSLGARKGVAHDAAHGAIRRERIPPRQPVSLSRGAARAFSRELQVELSLMRTTRRA